MRKRAEDVAETRRRIVDAAVRLHGTVGPGRTTIAGIAAEAEVTRLTVYRHFPDDEALFAACSAEWLGRQALPDPQRWQQIADPAERLRTGLADIYRFYRDGQELLRLVERDREDMPESQRRDLADQDREFRDVLLEPFDSEDGLRLRAAIGHAVSFPTWESLCVRQGLSNRQAVEVMTALVLAVGGGV